MPAVAPLSGTDPVVADQPCGWRTALRSSLQPVAVVGHIRRQEVLAVEPPE